MSRTTGDTAPPLSGNVSANITGATEVKVNVACPDDTVVVLDGTVTDGPNGGWTADYAEDTFPQAGRHDVQVRIRFANGKRQTFRKDAAGKQVSFIQEQAFA